MGGYLVVKGARWDLELARGLQGRHAAFDGLNGGRDVTVGVLLVALPLQLLRGDVGGDASATCICNQTSIGRQLASTGCVGDVNVNANANEPLASFFR